MKNKILFLSVVVLTVLFAHSALAYETSFETQIAEHNNTILDQENIQLAKNEYNLKNVYLSLNFPEDNLFYILTSNGTYMIFENQMNFKKLTYPEIFNSNEVEVKFEGDYENTGNLLIYTSEELYVSYNYGDSWEKVDLGISEGIVSADFGPDFSDSEKIYFITESGLYRKDMSDDSVVNVYSDDEEIKDFKYSKYQTNADTYYIVKNNAFLSTSDDGDKWYTHSFENNIKQMEVIPHNTNSDNIMVLTEDNVLQYSGSNFGFIKLKIPEVINEIYSFTYEIGDDTVDSYVILTDQGFYFSSNTAQNWIKLEYSIDPKSDLVKDFDLANLGSKNILYVIIDNVLYRDIDLKGVLNEYMNGLWSEEYYGEGEVISHNILVLEGEGMEVPGEVLEENHMITSATLDAAHELNDQTITYYMQTGSGYWEEVVPGEEHIFEIPGVELYWKAVLNTEDLMVTPVLQDVSVEYVSEEVDACAGFLDIPLDHPSCDAIEYVKAEGIFEGYLDGTFRADEEINRAETVKVVSEGFDYEILEDSGDDLGFSDVIIGEWYMKYLRTAFEAMIIEGYDDGTFRPDNTVNYVEMIKIFFETADVELGGLAEGDEWYQPYVDYASANEFTIYEDLAAGMTRGDVAELFYHYSLM